MAHGGFLLNENLARPGEQADLFVTACALFRWGTCFPGSGQYVTEDWHCEWRGNTNSFSGSCQKVSGGRDESKKPLI
jgi:hypothetical protein